MGHHEIFHVFVLLGSLAHFLSVYCYVIYKKRHIIKIMWRFLLPD